MANFCYNFVKYLLFFFNFLFVIAGLAIVAVGVYCRVLLNASKFAVLDTNEHDFTKFYDLFCAFTYVVIFLGFIVVLISFSGCCGALSEVRCLLITYSTIMLILALANIFFTAVVFIYKDQLQMKVEAMIDATFVQSNNDVYIKEFVHSVEAKMKCCGTTGPVSYPYPQYPSALPASCCQSYNINKSLPRQTCASSDAFHNGCTKVIGDAMMYHANKIAYSMIGIIVLEFITVLSAIYLCRCINEKQEPWHKMN